MSTTVTLATLAFVIGGAILCAFALLRANRTKGRLGINLSAVRCPACEHPAPVLRPPASPRQALWGGWTCRSCGAGIDKWGRPTAS